LRGTCLGCQPIQRSVGSFVIVLLSPVPDKALGFLHCRQQPAMQTALAQAPLNALVLPVLPRTPRVNQMGIARLRLPPGRDPLRDARRTVITFDILRSATLRTQPPQHLDDIRRRDRAGTGALSALARGCIKDGEALQPASIGGLGMDKGRAPDVMRRGCPRRRSGALASGTPLRRSLDDWESLMLPDAADSLARDTPPCRLAQVGELPRAPAWRPL